MIGCTPVRDARDPTEILHAQQILIPPSALRLIMLKVTGASKLKVYRYSKILNSARAT